jgi:TonB family protein
MITCATCGNHFDESFSFCPLDATSLELTPRGRRTFAVTIIDPAGLLSRLLSEIRFQHQQMKTIWPRFKLDPRGVTAEIMVHNIHQVRRLCRTPNVLAALAISLLVVLSLTISVALIDKAQLQNQTTRAGQEELQLIATLSPAGNGVGEGSVGKVGFKRGTGEGSDPQKKSARGGGGGGAEEATPAKNGDLPLPSVIPAPLSLPPRKNPALPVAGIDLDVALWNATLLKTPGDPSSTFINTSNGPGTRGGIGDGDGTGVGPGSGPGVGPGEKGNIGGGERRTGGLGEGGSSGDKPDDPDHVYAISQVEQRVRLLAKPEPQYSEEARRNQIVGTVVLRVVFSRFGEVTNIRTLQPLPFGLTERAIAAARNIRFVPAMRNGRPVSVHMQLEYNFNLY